MSAITGICECLAISGSASASSWLGQATRTIWQPEAVSSAICCSVALTSAVRVVVIDCTEIGAPPPIMHAADVDLPGRPAGRERLHAAPRDPERRRLSTVSTFPADGVAVLLDA